MTDVNRTKKAKNDMLKPSSREPFWLSKTSKRGKSENIKRKERREAEGRKRQRRN